MTSECSTYTFVNILVFITITIEHIVEHIAFQIYTAIILVSIPFQIYIIK